MILSLFFEHDLKVYPEVTFIVASQLKAYSNHYSYKPYPAIDFYIELPIDFNREFFPWDRWQDIASDIKHR